MTVRMQSGYRSVSYQKKLYDNKTQYYRDKGLSEAAARKRPLPSSTRRAAPSTTAALPPT